MKDKAIFVLGWLAILVWFLLTWPLIIVSRMTWPMTWAVWLPKSQRPSILNETHGDWPIPILRKIPRAVSAWVSTKLPWQLLGTNPKFHHQDIPERGTWCLSWPWQLVIYFTNGWLFRFYGLRFDYQIEGTYYNLGATVKKYD